MNKEQLLWRISYFLDPGNNIGAALYFVLLEGDETIIRFADIEDGAKGELLQRFLAYIREMFVDNKDLHYLNVSQADERKNAVYRYDIDKRPEGLNILDEILADGEKEPFNFSGHGFENLQGYLITIGNEGNQLALYKKHYPVNLFKRDRFLLIPSKQRLVALDNDAIALDKSFDFMMVDGTLIVLKLNTLERHFGFEEVIRIQAKDTIALIEASALLEDIEQLNELADNLPNARKLMKIRTSPVLGVPATNVINFIKSHPDLTGKIGFNDDASRVRLTTSLSKKLFLKLLNDDYLFSQLTESQYESLAKDRLHANPGNQKP